MALDGARGGKSIQRRFQWCTKAFREPACLMEWAVSTPDSTTSRGVDPAK